MRNNLAGRLVVGGAVLVILIGIALRFVIPSPQAGAKGPTKISSEPQYSPARTFSLRSPPSPPEEDPAAPGDEQIDQLLPRDKIEQYLTLHHRDAASLLAAFCASDIVFGNRQYLREAATNFPGNPRVQLAVLSKNLYPQERRKWLEAFKSSSPSNSLAFYLSAEDHFKSDQPKAAINELLAASRQPEFQDYAMQSWLGTEELFRFTGESPLFSSMAALSASQNLVTLSKLRNVADSIHELQAEYVERGDSASVQNLSEFGVGLAQRLVRGNAGKFVGNQSVGLAIERDLLQALDQSTPYSFLNGKTPAQRLDEIQQTRADIREVIKSYSAFFEIPEQEMGNEMEREMFDYLERIKATGELEAGRWLAERAKAKSKSGD